MRARPDVLSPRARRLGGVLTARPVPYGLAALALSLLAYAMEGWAHQVHPWQLIDLDVYRSAGAAARQAVPDLFGRRFDDGLPFTYPPAAALIFAPLSFLSLWSAQVLVTVLSVVGLVAVAWVTLGMTGRARSRERFAASLAFAAVAIWLEPVAQTLGFGQIDVLLMFVVLIDLSLPDRRAYKGIGVGIATGIKLTPGIFIVYLLLTKRFRAAAVATGAFGATIAAGWAFLPADSRRFWLDRIFLKSDRVGGVSYVANQSLHGVVIRLMGDSAGAGTVTLVLTLVVGVAGLASAVRAAAHSELLAVLLTALTGLLVSPVSWSHHWVYVVPCLVLFVEHALTRGGRAWWAPVGLVAAFATWPARTPLDVLRPLGLIWYAPSRDQFVAYHWHGWQLLAGNAEVLVGLGLLGYACAHLLFARGGRNLPIKLGRQPDRVPAGS